jgi:hypothetical protein
MLIIVDTLNVGIDFYERRFYCYWIYSLPRTSSLSDTTHTSIYVQSQEGILEALSFRDLNYIEVLVVSIKVHTSPYAEQD